MNFTFYFYGQEMLLTLTGLRIWKVDKSNNINERVKCLQKRKTEEEKVADRGRQVLFQNKVAATVWCFSYNIMNFHFV